MTSKVMAGSLAPWLNAEMSVMRTVEVDATRLAYLEVGPADAEVVLLLHGCIGSHRTWRRQIGPLSAHHRVVAIDWFGWGESGRNLELAYDYDTEVKRLSRVMDAIGVERATLVGHDYGGFLSLGFTLRFPERVARLCLINSRAQGTFNSTWRSIFGSIGWLCQQRGGPALVRALPLGAVFRRSMHPLFKDGYLDDATLEHYIGWMDLDPAGKAYLVRFHQDYRVQVRPELVAGLASIDCPTAVIWGARRLPSLVDCRRARCTSAGLRPDTDRRRGPFLARREAGGRARRHRAPLGARRTGLRCAAFKRYSAFFV